MQNQKKTLYIMLAILVVVVALFIIVTKIDLSPKTDDGIKETTLVDVPMSDVVSIRIDNVFGNYTYLYNSETKEFTWSKDDTVQLNSDALLQVMSAATMITTNKDEIHASAEDYGLTKNEIEVVIETKDRTYDYLIGEKNEVTGEYYMCFADDLNTLYLINEYKAQVLNCSLMDFKM